jgi:chemotaxis protein MotB
MSPRIRFSIAILLPLSLFACVSTSTYQQKADQAAGLTKDLENLTLQHSALQTQNNQCLADQGEFERQLTVCQKETLGLKQTQERAQADIARLELVLTDRNLATGKAMTEMRQTISKLTDDNRKLEEERQRQSTESLRLADEYKQAAAEKAQLAQALELEKQAREAQLEQLNSTYGQLLDKMRSEIDRGEITISELQGKLTVNLVERIIFDSGSAEVKSGGKEVLRKVGGILSQVADKEIRVEGHTDNIPISSKLQATYPSNWDLSSARAINVLQFLRSTVGIPGERLVACGFGEFRPLGDNATAEGRAQNRRIQIVLVPLDSTTLVPVPAK